MNLQHRWCPASQPAQQHQDEQHDQYQGRTRAWSLSANVPDARGPARTSPRISCLPIWS